MTQLVVRREWHTNFFVGPFLIGKIYSLELLVRV